MGDERSNVLQYTGTDGKTRYIVYKENNPLLDEEESLNLADL
jgi:hypothetical protein